MISISIFILYCTWCEFASSVRSVRVPIASMWYSNLSHVLRDLFREAQGKADEPAYIYTKKKKDEKASRGIERWNKPDGASERRERWVYLYILELNDRQARLVSSACRVLHLVGEEQRGLDGVRWGEGWWVSGDGGMPQHRRDNAALTPRPRGVTTDEGREKESGCYAFSTTPCSCTWSSLFPPSTTIWTHRAQRCMSNGIENQECAWPYNPFAL